MGQFGHILAQNGPRNLPKKNLMLSYLNNYYIVSSCKTSENFSHSMARKLQKTLFLGQFGPILAQNGPKNLPKKKLMLSYLNNYYFVSSCKKSENFSRSVARKLRKTLFLGKFGPKIRHFGPKRANKIFFEKSGFVTF